MEELKDEGLIETYWEQPHQKFYLIRPVNMPVSRLLDPITLQALTGHLIGNSQAVDGYKKLLNGEIPTFDTIPLVKNIEYTPSFSKLTGVSLIGSFSENMPDVQYKKKENQNEL